MGILVVRKTRPAVKTSCWPLVRHYIEKGGIACKANLSDLRLTSLTRSFFLFDGLDSVAKKKSIEGINFVWVEELAGMTFDTCISAKDVRLLNTICRHSPHPNRMNQIFASFNPVDPLTNSWIEAITKRGDTQSTQLLHLNHIDNPFLSDADYWTIEQQAEEDAQYDQVYRKGQWGLLQGQIYDNWDIVSDMPDEYEQRIWGLDFGYVNPCALIEIRIVANETYEQEWIYEKGLTIPDLIERVKDIIDPYEQIIADAAQPASIQELKNASLNVFPCHKGEGTVRHGINSVRSFKTHLLDTSENLIKEKRFYKWAMDVDDNIKQPPKPAKINDHLMDAERYAISWLRTRVMAGIAGETDGDGDQEDWLNPDNEELWS